MDGWTIFFYFYALMSIRVFVFSLQIVKIYIEHENDSEITTLMGFLVSIIVCSSITAVWPILLFYPLDLFDLTFRCLTKNNLEQHLIKKGFIK